MNINKGILPKGANMLTKFATFSISGSEIPKQGLLGPAEFHIAAHHLTVLSQPLCGDYVLWFNFEWYICQ